jgi:hypothetical protein
MSATPAARPSSPSIRLSALIIVTIQTSVTTAPSGPNST